MEFHIIPFDDLEEHEIDMDCLCNPRTTYIGEHKMVVHCAYDGREHIEELIEDLGIEMNYKGWEIWGDVKCQSE